MYWVDLLHNQQQVTVHSLRKFRVVLSAHNDDWLEPFVTSKGLEALLEVNSVQVSLHTRTHSPSHNAHPPIPLSKCGGLKLVSGGGGGWVWVGVSGCEWWKFIFLSSQLFLGCVCVCVCMCVCVCACVCVCVCVCV